MSIKQTTAETKAVTPNSESGGEKLVEAKINTAAVTKATDAVEVDGVTVRRGETVKVPAALLERENSDGLPYLVPA
jgi:hypothetical protein